MPCSGNESFVLDTRPSGSLRENFREVPRTFDLLGSEAVPAEIVDFTDRSGTKLRERVKPTRCCLNSLVKVLLCAISKQ